MGLLLFSADAAHVVRNPAFQTKLLLIAAGAGQHRDRACRPVAACVAPLGVPEASGRR